MQSSNCNVCSIVSSVGFAACDGIALMGHRSELSTTCPKNKNLPHTCWMHFLPCLSNTPPHNTWHVSRTKSTIGVCFFDVVRSTIPAELISCPACDSGGIQNTKLTSFVTAEAPTSTPVATCVRENGRVASITAGVPTSGPTEERTLANVRMANRKE